MAKYILYHIEELYAANTVNSEKKSPITTAEEQITSLH